MARTKRKTNNDFPVIKRDIQAIKRSLKNFATKDDLKNFATKDDLKNFATKDDLKNFATKKDFFILQDDLIDLKEELEAKIKGLPTRDEFYTTTDKIMKELQDMREEHLVLVSMKGQVNNHEDRIETIEDKLEIQAVVA